MRIRVMRAPLLVLAVVAFAGPVSAQVGVVAVTAGETSARQGSALQVGQPITTGADGHVDLIFVDGSTVAAGPNSGLVIERFGYDASRRSGELVTRLD